VVLASTEEQQKKGGSMHSDTLKGIAVVSMTEGSRLGRVEESLFDPQTLHLAALRIKGDSGGFMVPMAQVRSIGTDAVMVESSAATQAAGTPTNALLGWDDLKKHKVVDEAGALLGTVSNLELDTATGDAVRLVIHKGGVFGLGGETTEVAVGQIKSIGNELITVMS